MIDVAPDVADGLDAAFRDRLGAVDTWDGFQGPEVWSDPAAAGRFVMVSWWATRKQFLAWMGRVDHRRSHARLSSWDARPRPTSFRRFTLIST